MRGVFANPARNLAAHTDVIIPLRGAGRYSELMRIVVGLLCSFLLLATVLGPAHPDRSSYGAHAGALHAVPLMAEALCGDGSGHGTCQPVVADEPQLINLVAAAGPSLFETAPVAAPNRTSAPDTPPPRRVF